MKTPPHLLPPPSNLAPLQGLVPPSWDLDDDTLNNDYVSYDELLRDVRNYTGVLDFTADIPPHHKNASGVSVDPQVHGLVDQIQDLSFFLRPLHLFLEPQHQWNVYPEQWRDLRQGRYHHRVKRGRRPDQGDFRRPPGQLQQEGGMLYATEGFLGLLVSRGVLPRRCQARLLTTQDQPRSSGGTFPGEYATKLRNTRSLHQHGHAGYCASA